jgi:DNA-binding winged helix-turn-helix (wHTH) protein/tetratricopeptide (TPR) repeat protein
VQGGSVLAFGDFRLRFEPPALYRDGRPVKLQAQPLRLLALLAGRAGELVTHREIQDYLWHDHVVDFAGGMHVCMRQIRTALGEEAGEPRYIETVARHGYRFIAPLRAVAGTEPAAPGPEPAQIAPAGRRGLRYALLLPAALAVAAIVLAAVRGDRPPAGDGGQETVVELYENAKQISTYEQRDRRVLAASLLQRALALDPEYGPAHALMADLITQHGAAYLGFADARDGDLVEHHLRIASRHGADQSDLLVTRGRQALYGDRRPGRAYDLFQRAIEANPANPTAWLLSAEVHYLRGDFDDALEANLRAEALSADPNGALWQRLQIFYLSQRFDELFALHDRLAPVQKTGAITIGVAMELNGRHEEAFLYIVDALRFRGIVIGDSATAQRSLRAGDKAAAYRWLLSEIRNNQDPPLGGKGLAILQALAGDRALAAATLRDYVRKFERMEEGTHLDCLCFLTLRQDPFIRQLAGEPLVQEAWLALDAIVASVSASAITSPATRSRTL